MPSILTNPHVRHLTRIIQDGHQQIRVILKSVQIGDSDKMGKRGEIFIEYISLYEVFLHSTDTTIEVKGTLLQSAKYLYTLEK